MKIVLKSVATTAAAALAIGGFSLAIIQPATADSSPQGVATASTLEVSAYVYQKLDPAKEAAWENSGVQRLLVTEKGTHWITDATIMKKLPADVCGSGWAVQQDQLEIFGEFVWPKTITYPEGFGDSVRLVDDKHKDLEKYGEVPECETPDPETTPTPEPEPSPTPTPDLTPTPENSPTPTPEPEPSPTPTRDTTPTPEPSPTPVPEPEPSTTPTPDPSTTPDPSITPTPVPSTPVTTSVTVVPGAAAAVPSRVGHPGPGNGWR